MKLFEFYDIVYLDVRFLNTTDFGMGFLSEFGFKFFDKNDNELKPLGLNVYYIDRIEVPEILSDRNKKIRLILDRPSNNPYKGRKCSRISTGALEYELMKKNNMNYLEAHRLAEKKYNYQEALLKFKKENNL